MRPVRIGETIRRAIAKLIMRAAEYQANLVCKNLQLCAGLKDGIEGATHAVGKMILKRSRARWSDEKMRGK